MPSLTPRIGADNFNNGTSALSEGISVPGPSFLPGEESHRSGFHSFASSPHKVRLRFAAKIEMITNTSSCSAMEDISAPDDERTGN